MVWRVYDAVTTALLALAGVVMFGLAIVNALLRYFFDHPLVWAEEFSRFSMVWATFLGVAIAYRAGQHVSITVLVGAMPGRLSGWFRIACHLLTLATAYVLWRSGRVVFVMFGGMTSPSGETTMGWVYAAIPACAALLAIEALRHLYADARSASGRAR